MPRHLTEQIKVQLTFFRRNKLARVIGLFLFAILSVALIPFIALQSSEMRFELIQQIQKEIATFTLVMGMALAILTMHYHINSRCIKMVLTKPCRPEWWVLSVFVSIALICSCLHALGVIIVVILSIVWKIPFQMGIVFVALGGVAQSVIALSWGILLAALLHPAVAIVIIMVLQERVLYWLMIVSAGTVQGTTDRIYRFLFQVIQQIVTCCYILIPSFSLFSDRVQGVYLSYRVIAIDWVYMACTMGYAFLLAAFCYLATTLIFMRRRYI